jgi:hypothetical protein
VVKTLTSTAGLTLRAISTLLESIAIPSASALEPALVFA